MTDRALGVRAAPAAAMTFGAFVATRSVALQRFAYLVTGNADDARDAVQDALLGRLPALGAAGCRR